MTIEAAEIMEKLKDKRAEYQAITSSDGSVNLDDIGNRIITEVLGSESSQQDMPSGNQAQAEVQRLRNQMAQMQASTIEQIAQVKAEATSREVEA
ncbi:Cbb3-type cytochrome c oxidase subunit CcoP [Gossypium arboreum]|uniref:Cbb3-type cytochrome c oxidase subunit CcoP n=1 Tax=Gossypium arboreum TaxID=29729 RepID=A0A0B0PBM8_GOSAR|nr:Cbb3-type cytochrome c oxidase subunit CcoP [Gossypium arboreum]